MLWVGGSIIIHGLATFGLDTLEHFVKDKSAMVRDSVTFAPGLLGWAMEALISGIFGLAVGLVLLAGYSVGKRVLKRG
jgi:hypothetical protein